MHLSKFLADRGAKARFCSESGLSPAFVSGICAGKAWPNRGTWQKIVAATGGQVTPNDHLHDPATEEPDRNAERPQAIAAE